MRRGALPLLFVLASCAAQSHPEPKRAPLEPAPPPPPPPGYAAPPPASPTPTNAPPAGRAETKKRDGFGGSDKSDKDGADRGALGEAIAELDLWARSVELSLSSCEVACRALGSMGRAVAHVCELSEDRTRCEDATRRLREARARVRASCGECRGGPTTDPDAPVR